MTDSKITIDDTFGQIRKICMERCGKDENKDMCYSKCVS